MTSSHIVIVSNRGPFSFSMKNGTPHAVRGSGGLVTAISDVVRQQNVLWISCVLSQGDRDWLNHVGDGPHIIEDMRIRLITPEPNAFHDYYNHISNSLLWFVQHQMHDTPRSPVIDKSMWKAWSEGYVRINRQLAEAVADSIQHLEGPVVVMPQDYHLYLVPQFLREIVGDRVTIQSFLHIPFPGPDAWRVLPLAMRQQLFQGMLQADRLGFQTERDTRRFLQTIVDTMPDVRVIKPWRRLAYQERTIDAHPYPISIDVDILEARLESEQVKTYLQQFKAHYKDRKLIMRTDRVEPSKNILRGFTAFRNFLIEYPAYQRRVEMLALLVPSRVDVPEYNSYLHDIMALVGEINATLGDSDWEPVRVFLSNNYDRAIAAFSLYDVLLVNPLADGMNLVAKEGALLNQRNGVLILSEEAGAAEEFGNAPLLVSPYDVYGTSQAIYQALNMPEDERAKRSQQLAQQVRQNDIARWFKLQLEHALASGTID